MTHKLWDCTEFLSGTLYPVDYTDIISTMIADPAVLPLMYPCCDLYTQATCLLAAHVIAMVQLNEVSDELKYYHLMGWCDTWISHQFTVFTWDLYLWYLFAIFPKLAP